MTTAALNVLSLQPFYGGSHRQFDRGWQKHSAHRWTTLTLPDRHWKWRMRHAAVEFAQRINTLTAVESHWNAIVCTDMLDLATLKGLVNQTLPPSVLYFHENQFAYPNRAPKDDDLHYPFTNLTSALAADQVWFNSKFNKESMLAGIEQTLNRFPDYRPLHAIDSINKKSIIQSPGVEVVTSPTSSTKAGDAAAPIKILWAARWEHDKGPNQLLEVLDQLVDRKIEFSISVVGQQYSRQPPAFEKIQKRHRQRIDLWGFVPREQYRQALIESDLFLSTANHEFFGLSFVEAVAAGCCPVLPDRLVYPGLISPVEGSDQLLFRSSKQAADIIASIADEKECFLGDIPHQLQTIFSQRYCWAKRAQEMDAQLTRLVSELG